MRLVYFTHSLVSDWNHGNAHFLRGVLRELRLAGHDVVTLEDPAAWSRQRLVEDAGPAAADAWAEAYPLLADVPRFYNPAGSLDTLGPVLADADVVIVHEWTEPRVLDFVSRRRREGGGFRLLFHDTHHRLVSAPAEMDRFDLSACDGILAFGRVLADAYVRRGADARRVFVWHEAADARLFRPLPREPSLDLVWVGNWGDGERVGELHEFLLGPCKTLGLRAAVHGVRYPPEALRALAEAGIEYRGWVANHCVPQVFADARVTVHVPRRWYRTHLPGIPTIRVFEAGACGIPLICAPWDDAEGLFPDDAVMFAEDGRGMTRALENVLTCPTADRQTPLRGAVLARHTCRHRADELLDICRSVGAST